MRRSARCAGKVVTFGIFVFCLTVRCLPADAILFIGNSFTFGGKEKAVSGHGGIPKLVEAIAASKGRTVSTLMVATGGRGWPFHLQNPATDTALKAKPWDWVILQDYSTAPTHAGNLAEFMKDGEAFYDRLHLESPRANIVLYETWAYDARHTIFRPSLWRKRFASPDEMIGELHQNYGALQGVLQAKDAGRRVLLAAVGTAFSRCLREHREINLYADDFKHPNREGSYLAALVIYATIFGDDPTGATSTFPGFALEAAEAAELQSVAKEVTGKAVP